ncbi:DivIVA domain-containing protein [Bacteroidota bacterium]
MKLSPLDIKKQEFSRGMRGYDVDEVRAFLATIAGQMDELMEEHLRSQNDLENHKGKMGHLEDVQEALQATLNMARQNSEETRKAALSKAEMIVHEAHLKGEEIMKKAERGIDKLRTDITHLETRRDQILAKLRSVLTAELEMLESLRPEPADRQTDSGVEVAALAYVDPAARAYKQELLAKAAAAAASQAEAGREAARRNARLSDESSGNPSADEQDQADQSDDGHSEVQNIADVVAALKAEVDGDPTTQESRDNGGTELEEMQKIRQILDDLE